MADGLSDEIAAQLFSAPGIRVVSRGTVGKYRGRRDIDARTVGQELGARLLMTGVLRGTGSRFTVTANLVDAQTGNNLWAKLFERDDGDFSGVRDDIVREIQRTVRDSFGSATTPATVGQSARPVDPGAYRDYLRGQTALSRRAQSLDASANLFRSAVEKDTLFAKAWSGLSLARALAPYFQPISTREVAGEVTAAAERALQLDSSLAQPHISLGLVHEYAFHWQQAESELRKAVGMDARDVEARVQYGRFLVFQDRLAEALEQFLAARDEEPASAVVSSWVAYAYYLDGQLDSALVESGRAMQSDSSNITTLVFGALIRLAAGDTAHARNYASRLAAPAAVSLYVLEAIGDSAAVMQRRRALDDKGRNRWLAETRRAYVLLGARDSIGAIAALERATDAMENWPTLQAVRDHLFDAVRTNPRFHTLLQRVGIPLSATRPIERR
jgi:adenylate cyclase